MGKDDSFKMLLKIIHFAIEDNLIYHKIRV